MYRGYPVELHPVTTKDGYILGMNKSSSFFSFSNVRTYTFYSLEIIFFFWGGEFIIKENVRYGDDTFPFSFFFLLKKCI